MIEGWQQASRADAAMCAALMATAPRWWWLAAVLTIVWALLVWQTALAWTWLGALGAWAWITWLTMRCELDARLFNALSSDRSTWQTADGLDESLSRVLKVRRSDTRGVTPESDMASRIAGARKLFNTLVGWALALAFVVAGLWCWRMGSGGV